MNAHPTNDEVLLFLRGGLRADRVAAVLQHLRQCARCASTTMPARRVSDTAAALARELDPATDEHPPLDSVLTPYGEGKLGGAAATEVEAHLAICGTCREDVADVRDLASRLTPKRSRVWMIASVAAVAAVVVIAATALLQRDTVSTARVVRTRPVPVSPPQPRGVEQPARYARAEWTAAVEDALRRGSLAMPATLGELHVPADPERTPAEIATSDLFPTGVVIDTTRPEFRWNGVAGATYVVSVFADQELVAESAPLREPRWRTDRDLRRGVVYEWQVAVRDESGERILPAPPGPPALFRILDRRAHDELESARAAHPGDSLLLGILYARHGMRDEAVRELSRLTTNESRRLLKSVQTWKTSGA